MPAPKLLQESAGCVELENRRIGAVNHPYVPARIELDAADLSQFNSRGKLRPGGRAGGRQSEQQTLAHRPLVG